MSRAATLARRGGQQPPALNAGQLSNLAVWLDASTLAQADGTALGTWPDASGNSLDATQATGANQPLVKTGILNGKRVVRFDGSNDNLVSPYTGEVGTIVALVYSRDGTTGNHTICGGKKASGFGSFYFQTSTVNTNASNTTADFIRTRTTDTTTVPLGAGTMSASGVWTVMVGTYNAATGTATFGFNSADPENTITLTPGTPSTSTATAVGCGFYAAGAVDFANVDIAELAIYSTVLTRTQLDQLGRGLVAKWGSSVPWRSIAPSPTDFTYLAVPFGFAYTGPESAYLMGSNDGATWKPATPLNVPPIPANSEKGIRNPSVFKHTDGFYYMSWTDVSVVGGSGFDNRSNVLVIARSADLVTWTRVARVTVSGTTGSYCVWSSNWFVDGTDVYMLTAICSAGSVGPFTMYAIKATSSDLTAWGAPVAVTGTGFPTSCIDPTMVKIGATYHLIYKDEGSTKHLNRATSSSPLSGYTQAATDLATGIAEGPQIVSRGGSAWRLYFDRYQNAGGNFLAYVDSTDNLATWGSPAALTYDQARFGNLRTGGFFVRT